MLAASYGKWEEGASQAKSAQAISVVGISNADGALLGGVIVFRDITSAKQAEEELRNAKQAAEAANASKTAFLANMSHEIRTPLSSILGFTELLRRDIGTPEDKFTYLDSVSSSGRHLAALIDDILDLSKIEAGRMEFEHVRCSPHQIITEVLSVLRVRAQGKSLSLECLWTSGVPETILTDPARLRQLLMNLVGNAIKFTEQGSVTLMATVTCESAEPRLLIEVRDTGIGIPKHRIEGIFNPFEQADSSITRRFGGTGLGLAISRHIAQGLGGEIDVQSVHGAGTVFRIQLATGPLQGVRILDEPPTEAIITSENGKESLATLPADCRVLLVEDGESNQQLIGLVLREAGAHVTCAWNGEEGLTVATRTQFDLILMDMQMPVMDGYTATERLRNLGCTVPIIALTAHAMRGDKEKCLAAGCTDYLTKPIDIDALIRTVAMSVQKASTGGKPTDSIEVSREQNRRKSVECSLPADNPRFRPIIDAFLARLQENLAEMQTAFTENDWKKVAELAHWLRGSGGTVGFNCFTEPSGRLELLVKAKNRDEAQRALEEIASLAERIALPV